MFRAGGRRRPLPEVAALKGAYGIARVSKRLLPGERKLAHRRPLLQGLHLPVLYYELEGHVGELWRAESKPLDLGELKRRGNGGTERKSGLLLVGYLKLAPRRRLVISLAVAQQP